jgi:hypothetical protein
MVEIQLSFATAELGILNEDLAPNEGDKNYLEKRIEDLERRKVTFTEEINTLKAQKDKLITKRETFLDKNPTYQL